MGVRTLSGVLFGDDWSDYRAPAEGKPRGAMYPVSLGAVAPMPVGMPHNDLMREIPAQVWRQPPTSAPQSYTPPTLSTPVISSAGSPVPATPVQTATPTPVVNVPPSVPTGAVLITSGGGTASPNLAPTAPATTYTTDAAGNIYNVQTGQMVITAAQAAAAGITNVSQLNPATAAAAEAIPATSTAAPTDITDQVAAWLGTSTVLFGYSVPNPLLVGVVVLGFALLDGMGGSKKR